MRAVLVFVLLVPGVLSVAPAQVINNWTNPFSARWESSSWSLGTLPASNQTVNITNAGYKAVNIDSGTVSGYGGSLAVSNLQVSAPSNALSTLLLNSAGLGMPLKVLNQCTIGTNGTLANYNSRFEVDGGGGGGLLVDGGAFIQEGGLSLVNAPVAVRNHGSMNTTNGNLTLGDVTLGSTNSGGSFTQDGGSIAARHLALENSRYTLVSGILYSIGGTQIDSASEFVQWGGTNYGDITANAAYYINGGMAQGNLLTIRGTLYQGAGLVDMGTVDWTGNNGNVLGLGVLRAKIINIHERALVFMGQGNITPGRVETDSLSISNNSNVSVTSYELFVTNSLVVRGDSTNASVYLGLVESLVRVGAMTLHDYSKVEQYGPNGRTELTSGLSMEGGQYLLEGGLLEGPYVGVGAKATFRHFFVATNRVHGVLSITGTYDIPAGTLVTDGLYLRGSLVLNDPQSASFATSFTNRGLLDLGGTLSTRWPDAWPGQVRLSTNATIRFIGSPAQLHFAPSSTVGWTPGALLSISNWNSSLTGNSHIYFGTNSSGLSASQLTQIRFVHPGGFPPGIYPARLTSMGELVPMGSPALRLVRGSSRLVLTWPAGYQLLSATNLGGPYNPVPGASSPWTNFWAKPREFFRLQPAG